MVLLMVDDAILKKKELHNDRRFEPKDDVILQKVAFLLCPVIFIFGIYIILIGAEINMWIELKHKREKERF